MPIQPWLPQSPSPLTTQQAEPQQTVSSGSPTAQNEEQEGRPNSPLSGKEDISEIEIMLEEEKDESEALTSYLRGLLQSDSKASKNQSKQTTTPQDEWAASFAFTRRLAELKNGF